MKDDLLRYQIEKQYDKDTITNLESFKFVFDRQATHELANILIEQGIIQRVETDEYDESGEYIMTTVVYTLLAVPPVPVKIEELK